MIDPPETEEVATRHVSCDGGPLGHPRVFLEIGGEGYVDCGYCDKRFLLKTDAAAPAGH